MKAFNTGTFRVECIQDKLSGNNPSSDIEATIQI